MKAGPKTRRLCLLICAISFGIFCLRGYFPSNGFEAAIHSGRESLTFISNGIEDIQQDLEHPSLSKFFRDYKKERGVSPPPGYDKWLDLAISKRCPISVDMYLQIYKDLQPWVDLGGIRPEYISNLGQHAIDLVEFSNGSFQWNGSNHYKHHSPVLTSRMANLLSPSKKFVLAITRTDVPAVLPSDPEYQHIQYKNMSEVVKHSSCLQQHYKEHLKKETHAFFLEPFRFLVSNNPVAPVFSRCKATCFKDILFPSNYHVMYSTKIHASRDTIEWKDKLNVLFWRGGPTGGPGYKYSIDDPKGLWRKYHRTRLMDWANKFKARYPERVFDSGVSGPTSHCKNTNTFCVDIGTTSHIFTNHGYKQYGAKRGLIPFKYILRYKYLVVVDGNGWPDRLQWYLGSNSVVLYNGIFSDFAIGGIEPWKHYVPISPDFSDLEAKVEWLQQNEDVARQITENAKAFIAPRNTRGYMTCYTGLLLLEYSRLYLDS